MTMRTIPLNTYRVTFTYTIETQAVHEDDAIVLARSDMERYIDDDVYRTMIVGDMAYTMDLIDGVEPGQDDE